MHNGPSEELPAIVMHPRGAKLISQLRTTWRSKNQSPRRYATRQLIDIGNLAVSIRWIPPLLWALGRPSGTWWENVPAARGNHALSHEHLDTRTDFQTSGGPHTLRSVVETTNCCTVRGRKKAAATKGQKVRQKEEARCSPGLLDQAALRTAEATITRGSMSVPRIPTSGTTSAFSVLAWFGELSISYCCRFFVVGLTPGGHIGMTVPWLVYFTGQKREQSYRAW